MTTAKDIAKDSVVGLPPALRPLVLSRLESLLDRPENLAGQINTDRKSTRLNSSHALISYAVFCLKKKKKKKPSSAFTLNASYLTSIFAVSAITCTSTHVIRTKTSYAVV